MIPPSLHALFPQQQEPIVAYVPAFTRLMGSRAGGLLLSQLLAWWSAGEQPFAKTDADVLQATDLTAKELRLAKRWLKQHPLGITMTVKGLPRATYYAINMAQLGAALAALPPRSTVQDLPAPSPDAAQPIWPTGRNQSGPQGELL